MKQLNRTITLSVLLLALLFVLNGCRKKAEPAPPPAPEETKEVAPAAVPVTIEQTTCPVMEGPVNKDIFTEYQGKKVYFCCPACKGQFEADPQKYLAKLPQFNK